MKDERPKKQLAELLATIETDLGQIKIFLIPNQEPIPEKFNFAQYFYNQDNNAKI